MMAERRPFEAAAAGAFAGAGGAVETRRRTGGCGNEKRGLALKVARNIFGSNLTSLLSPYSPS